MIIIKNLLGGQLDVSRYSYLVYVHLPDEVVQTTELVAKHIV